MKKSENMTIDIIGSFLKQLSERSDYVYWLSTPDLKKIQFISPAAYKKIWGRDCDMLYERPESWADSLHPEDIKRRNPVEDLSTLVAKKGPNAIYEESYRIVRPDGEVRWILDRGFPIYDKDDNCIGVTGVAIDISSEKIREKLLETASRAKSEFIANMSHDLRTPMSGISGMLDGLQFAAEDAQSALESDTELSAEKQGELLRELIARTHEYVGIAKGSTDELLHLFNEILETMQLESGKVEVIPEVFELRPVVKRHMGLLQSVAEHKNLDLSLSFDKKIPDYLKGSRQYLDRILLNLISNALKFTESGDVNVSVSLVDKLRAAYKKGDGLTLRIQVKDTGVGIPKDKFEEIFEHFSRLTSSYQGIYKGAGLGLYTVKRYVEAMQGQIEVDSELGKGTCFTVTLPFTVEDYAEPIRESIQSSIKRKVATLKKESLSATVTDSDKTLVPGAAHVLLVEDNVIAAMGAKLLLERLECSVELADHGEAAMEKVSNKDFDLIFMDIGLPDITGIEVTERIRTLSNKKSDVPIVALTGHASGEQHDACLAAGMNEVLTKPPQLPQLQSALEKWVWHHKPDAAESTSASSDVDSSVIDWEACLHLAAGKASLAEFLLASFYDVLDEEVSKIASAYSKKDTDAMRFALHHFLGGLLCISLPRLLAATKAFQAAAKATHQDPSEIEKTYQVMQEEVENFQKAYQARQQ